MGCRASKTVSQEERTMPKLGPFLRRRLPQIRKIKSFPKEHYRPADDVSFGSSEGYAKVAPVPLEPEEMVPQDKEMEKEVMEVAGIGNATLEETDGEEDDDERISRGSGVLLCPSPSFRIYVKEETEEKEEERNEDEDDAKIEELEKIAIIEPVNSMEVTAAKEKHKKRRTLSKVMSKGKPVKNLLKVKSCYYPSCVCSSRHSRLIAAN